MKQIETSRKERLNELHNKILGSLKTTIELAIEAGEILINVKESLPHGQFTKWVEENTSFDIRTAQRYMKAHRNRDRLENDSVSHLKHLLEPEKDAASGEVINTWERFFECYMNDPLYLRGCELNVKEIQTDFNRVCRENNAELENMFNEVYETWPVNTQEEILKRVKVLTRIVEIMEHNYTMELKYLEYIKSKL